MSSLSVKVYPNDVKVTVKKGKKNQTGSASVRGRISSFSEKSKRRLLFTAFNASVDWFAFITLTYPSEFPTNGRACERHFDTFMKRLKRKYPGLKYLAAKEWQERGAPHWHILVSEFVDLRWLSQAWYEVVGSEDLKHLRAGTSVQLVSGRKEGAGYMAKVYTAKSAQKEVPEGFEDVGRFWFSSRGLVQVEREMTIDEYEQAVKVVRTLRHFVEKSLKPKKHCPVRDGRKRKRKVKRVSSLQFLHTGFRGLTAYNGSSVGRRLLDELGGRDYAGLLGLDASDVKISLPDWG